MDEAILLKFNETDVREEIIAPLLRRLGYRSGTNNNIVREQRLRYEKSYLGHKKPKTDWLLTGKADYICETEGLRRWTVEAKHPNEEISIDDIEQAFSYARHPEVKAIYYCLCNGREFRIYQTADAPDVNPTLSLKFEELEASHYAIESLLSPSALIKNHPEFKPDFGQPLGKNLRSLARITGGHIVLQRSQPSYPAFKGFTIFITGGAVQRDESKRLTAFLESLSPFEPLQKLNERLGLSSFEVRSNDSVLSTEGSKPTVFQYAKTVSFAKSEKLYDFTTGNEFILPNNLTCNCEVSAKGAWDGLVFAGDFQAVYDYLEFHVKVSLDGKFKIHIS